MVKSSIDATTLKPGNLIDRDSWHENGCRTVDIRRHRPLDRRSNCMAERFRVANRPTIFCITMTSAHSRSRSADALWYPCTSCAAAC